MNGRAAYLDASAVVKLVVAESESGALRNYLVRWPTRASSALTRTEVIRALHRAGYDSRVAAARRLFHTLHLIRLDEPLLDHAADLPPRELRSLDAVHVASALALGSELGVLLTYDVRLAEAAKANGLHVEAPR